MNLALDRGHLVGGLSGEHLVAKIVLHVGDLVDPQLPLSTVSVLNGDHGVELVGTAMGPGGGPHVARHNLLKVEGLKDVPGLLDGNWEHGALDLVGGDRHS
jgi:hypothetical protein